MISDIFFIIFILTVAANCFSPVPSTSRRHFCRVAQAPALTMTGGAVLDNEEPLSAMFQRAVVLQQSGNHKAALKEYELFIKAAKQCDVSPDKYAEVHVNIGAVYIKDRNIEMAKHHFEQALQVGTAHVNLALLALQKGSQTMDPMAGIAALEEAKEHCEKAIALDNSVESTKRALHLLGDINLRMEKVNDETSAVKSTNQFVCPPLL